MNIGIEVRNPVSVRRYAPGDPVVQPQDNPDRKNMASRILDGVIASKYSAKTLEAMVDQGIEHTRGRVVDLSAHLDSLPKSTSAQERAAWERELNGQVSGMESLLADKTVAAEKFRLGDALMRDALKMISPLVSPQEAASLYREREAAFAAVHPSANEDAPGTLSPGPSPQGPTARPFASAINAPADLAAVFGAHVTAVESAAPWRGTFVRGKSPATVG